MAENLAERIRGLEVELAEVKRGVANFRAFQLENREFMGWFKAQEEDRAKTDKRRSKLHFTLLGLLIALIVALFSFMLNHFDNNKRSALVPFISQSMPQDASATATGRE